MERYNPKKLEQKWSEKWLEENVYEPDLAAAQRPFYNLMMFPYPSAEGLHIGAVRTFSGVDIYGRFKRMQGYDVFEPIGLDGFGIHSENYALKIGKHPIQHAKDSEKNFYRQLSEIGNGFAWNEKLETYDPAYYKWTQWIFTQMFKHGLAYRKMAPVNWCLSCKTVLADEQVISGKCERCDSQVITKELEQWFFKITDYAERLLKNLEKLDWSERVKIAQKNWIGRSEGAEIEFGMHDLGPGINKFVLLHGKGGSPKRNFIPWLKSELEKSGYAVQVPQLPNADEPDDLEQADYVLKNCKLDEQTVVIGHSFGGVVALRMLERGVKLHRVILVGTPRSPRLLDNKKRPSISAALKRGFDFNVIKKNAQSFVTLYDEKDHIVPLQHGKSFADALGTRLIKAVGNQSHFTGEAEPEVLQVCLPSVKIFTTRPDTLFGATYLVLSPEHRVISNLQLSISNQKEVDEYIRKAGAKTEEERIAESRDKTGVELKGIKAINPATKEEIPIWVADYVLGHVGTGAIMAVPAHDQRDFEFARKYKLPIREVVVPNIIDKKNPPVEGKRTVERRNVHAIVKDPNTGKYLALKWKKFNWVTFPMGGVEEGEDIISAAMREVKEETGFVNLRLIKVLDGQVRAEYFAGHKDENRIAYTTAVVFELIDGARAEVDEKEKESHDVIWLDEPQLNYENMTHAEMGFWNERLRSSVSAYVGGGVLMNSGKFNGMDSEKAKWEITKFVRGERKTQYRLRDWLISRQRYWGPPIPMIFCENCKNSISGSRTSRGPSPRRSGLWPREGGKSDFQKLNRGELENPGWTAVPEKDLPVKLPYIKNFRPTGTDKSPLATVGKFYKVLCPKCHSWARRETDVSDAFLDSSWYYLGYLAKGNSKFEIRNSKFRSRAKQWLPVNMYIGGAEHSVLHLMYSRFVAMSLHDMGILHFSAKGGSASGGEEPFTQFRAHGLILKDGAKMSKSRGNVVNPDEYIRAYGTDAIRMYLAFLSPLTQDGDFRDTGIRGITRFLERVWKLIFNKNSKSEIRNPKQIQNHKSQIQKTLHKTIKKVTEDIENLQYNTAIAALMTLLNKFEESPESVSREHILIFLKLLAPFAPFITEEIYHRPFDGQMLNVKGQGFHSIHLEPWPKYDPKLIQEEAFELVVQINGKVRDKFEAPIDISEEEAKRLTLEREKVKNIIRTQKPRKVIFVPKRLVNIVI